MNLFPLPGYYWVIGKGILFTLLGLLALDGGLCITSAFAFPGVTITPSPVAFTGTVGPGPLTIPVTFTNSGASPVSFTWTDSIPWIKAGYPAGTLTRNAKREHLARKDRRSIRALRRAEA